jgi:hypothetical protein
MIFTVTVTVVGFIVILSGTILAFSVYGSSPTNKGIIVIALALILT